MSHRTTPVFELPIRSIRNVAPPQPPKDATLQLFDALDNARFDQVRRAVAAYPACLSADKPPSSTQVSLNVLDYALSNAHTWTALLDHCRRTASPQPGTLPLRDRLTATTLILTWLLRRSDAPSPTETTLHSAISCRFNTVAIQLITSYPTLARSVDARSKTPLHVICGLAPLALTQAAPTEAVCLIRHLMLAGALVNARDADLRTPLHDLISSLAVATPLYGLRHRRYGRTLTSVIPIIDELLLHGASLHAVDKTGQSVLHAALQANVHHMVLLQRAVVLRNRLCASGRGTERDDDDYDMKCCTQGLWGCLPFDIVVRIMGFLSPWDVIMGIGATCKGLRAVAVSKLLWRHLEMPQCLMAIRERPTVHASNDS